MLSAESLKIDHLRLVAEYLLNNDFREDRKQLVMETISNGSYNIFSFNEYNYNSEDINNSVSFTIITNPKSNSYSITNIVYKSENKQRELIDSFELNGKLA
jgi:hypothetical protein